MPKRGGSSKAGDQESADFLTSKRRKFESESSIVGTVVAAFRKQDANRKTCILPFLLDERVELEAQEGVVSDLNRNTLSPRQVLLSDLAVMRELGIEPGMLCENFCIKWADTDTARLKSGMQVKCGSAVLRVTFNCEPCGHVIDYMKSKASVGSSPSLEETKNISSIPCLTDLAPPKRGVLATVVKGGFVKVGDVIAVVQHVDDDTLFYESIPFATKEKILWLLGKIPRGKVVGYKDALQYVGTKVGWARAFPSMLNKIMRDEIQAGLVQGKTKKLDTKEWAPAIPFHRLVLSSGELGLGTGEGVECGEDGIQADLLRRENVKVGIEQPGLIPRLRGVGKVTRKVEQW
eukprot:CAMPEP_0181305168 /NCGR_PEP_ID=MMETSP1101-20121128/9570_1 /TAXON_ID=46948 /ORGANISM="Rhodomonas abbreviata, Strain Caron Lab Isolate" /LENGTH=347 /DNA_ID=CAMNT_0023411035 /DNA_START=389 /DNA_END=1429 /DNA_ORIENTATION=+